MSSEWAVEAIGLSKSFQIYGKPRDRLLQSLLRQRRQLYREIYALRDVSFRVRRGETLGIVGRNGSGKSTLLQLLCGTLTPSAGQVEVRGRISALLELGAGFNPDFSGRENVFLNGAILGLSRQELDARFQDIVNFSELGDFVDHPVRTYSSGMFVRLAFAVAVCLDPEIMVVDEALSVGDEAFQRKCFARLMEMNNHGTTIIFVSHSSATVIELCERAILLDRGEMLINDKPKTVINYYQQLLYAPIESREKVRGLITSLDNVDIHCDASENECQNDICLRADTMEEERGNSDQHFDKTIIPASTLTYESFGATIRNVKIVDGSGATVNILEHRATYKVKYDVVVDADINNVRYAMGIKTVSGFELGGLFSHPASQPIPYLKKGAVAKVCFDFCCIFNSGTYFLNVAVHGILGSESLILHRIVDAACFKVQEIRSGVLSGLIDYTV